MGIFKKDLEAIRNAKQKQVDIVKQAEKQQSDQGKVAELSNKGFYACTEEERNWLFAHYPKEWDRIRNEAYGV